MLLYVLELINQIAKDKNKDIDAYSVELEKTEDFCIICDSEYKSFHQVKAYLSKDKWNSYSKAMDKLLKHRAESNNPTAKCYLTVAKEIKDWDDASNTYNVSVELYKRASKGLDILLIDDPLQTIDDISAISLADLLTQQGIGQIVLSTHEEAKAALLRYKFKHAGMSVREQNMQALYMKTVTEE